MVDRMIEDLRHREPGEQDKRSQALERLLDLCETDPSTKLVMDRCGADRSMLRRLYFALLASGAGCWARGHWVAASALVFASPLAFVLERDAAGMFETRYEKMDASRGLVKYFEKGELGLIA
jgi:hypothetical protein